MEADSIDACHESKELMFLTVSETEAAGDDGKVGIEPPSQRMHRKQRYRAAWEKLVEFEGWLSEDPTSPYKARCLACKVSMVAERTVLKNHGKCMKHKRRARSFVPSKGFAFEELKEEVRHTDEDPEDNQPLHQTILISTSQDDGNVHLHGVVDGEARVTIAQQKLKHVLTDMGFASPDVKKVTTVLKQCLHDSRIVQSMNVKSMLESGMSRNIPVTCIDPFFMGSVGKEVWNTPPLMDPRLSKLYDQNFAVSLQPDKETSGSSSIYFRSRRTLLEKSGLSFVTNTSHNFSIMLEVPHFRPEELKVRVTRSAVEVEGKHAQRQDQHGTVERHFVRRYAIPDDVMIDLVSSSFLSADGVLTIEAPKKPPRCIRTTGREVHIKKKGRAAK